MKINVSKLFLACLLSQSLLGVSAQVDIAPRPELLDAPFTAKDLENFKSPPKVFYPETWFHFIGGNVSKEGIDADLEAISEAGISGIQWFHGNFGGQWPETNTQIKALTPEWEDIVSHMGSKATELGLRLTVQTCPGWAMAGGPWIKPSEAMRDFVWSKTYIDSETSGALTLPKPQPSNEEWRDYRDICVLAFPTPVGDGEQPYALENVTSDDDLDWKGCLDSNAPKAIRLQGGKTHKVNFTLKEGSVVRTLVFPCINTMNGNFVYKPEIHVCLTARKADAVQSDTLVNTEFPSSNWQDFDELFLSCNEVDGATQYEFTITNKHDITLNYLRFLPAAMKNNWRAEAGWTLMSKERSQEHPAQSKEAYVDPQDIIDISQFMSADGKLNWKVPSKGRWTVLRLGNVNKGWKNSPAPPEATGWECNKLNSMGADVQFANYVGYLVDKPLKDSNVGGMLMDSWECSTQTWTESMEQDFRAFNGYELRKWLPAVLGYVIGSQETTTRFLLDWRRCLTSLYNTQFFKRMTDLAHQKGLKVQYETAGGDVVPIDVMEYFKYADVPMCEFWQPFSDGYVGDLNFKPIRNTASAANLYGKRRVAAESFTSFALTWNEHLQMLKEVANFNMIEGVTHCVFHTYTHNPQVGSLPPGTSFGSGIGTPFLRGQTWWKHMPQFTSYLARTGYMLERGKPVRHVLWYLGDEITQRPDQFAAFPEGYQYDYCNPDVLLNRLSVKDGKLVTPEGISYDMLWIPENQRMLPETLVKLRQLIDDGAAVAAARPSSPATLSAAPKDTEKRFRELVKSIWGKQSGNGVINIGKGRLVTDTDINKAIKTLGVKPDLKVNGGEVQWLHRKAEGAEWYYVTAPRFGEFHGEVDFLCTGTPELWDAVTGKAYAATYSRQGEYTRVRLDLCRAENCFVVFRKDNSTTPGLTERFPVCSNKVELKEPWTVKFTQGWGAPELLVEDVLQPIKDMNMDKEGKCYSGTVVYETSFDADGIKNIEDLVLSLGKVSMIASVKVNDVDCGVLWAEPYKTRIGHAVKPGRNKLTVEVTTTWYNRLVYDAGLPEAERKTWTISGPGKDSQLSESGLMGPVNLEF